MKLKSIGALVRAGIIAVGGSAAVIAAAENLASAKNDEALTIPVSNSIAFSGNTSDISSESTHESTVIYSNESPSSSSASVEVRTEPPVSSDTFVQTSSEPQISSSEQSSTQPPPEESKPILSATVIEPPASENTSTENFPEPITYSVQTSTPISTSDFSSSTEISSISSSTISTEESSSESGSSVFEPPVSSEVISSSSALAEVSEPPEQASDSPLLPEPDEPDIVNINTASSEELQTLWGIGEDKAAAIIEYREHYGSFADIYDIKRVDGIGDIEFEAIRNYITV